MQTPNRSTPASRIVFLALFAAASAFAQASSTNTAAATAEKPRMNIAVLTLKAASGVTDGESEIITDRLRAELFNTGAVNIMEREQMQAILKEQGFQQSGTCSDQACMVEMGKLLGVQQIYTGSIGKVGSMFLLNLRIVDVSTGQVVKAVSRDINGMEVVVSRLPDISRELVGQLGRTAPSAPAPPQSAQSQPTESSTAPSAAPAPPATPEEEKAAKNKNRLGIRLGFSAFFGETWWKINAPGMTSMLNDQVDTIVSQPVMVPNGHLIIPLGSVLSLEIGGGFAFWGQHIGLSPATTGGNADYIDVSNSYGYFDGAFNFVKRWYPLKLNVGVTAGYAFFSTANSASGTDPLSWADSLAGQASAFTVGGRAGVEVLAGPHVGFNFDLLYRYVAFAFTSGQAKVTVTPPPLGIGGGLNIYF